MTAVTVTSGKQIQTGDYIRIESEIMLVTAGGGTTSLTVTRAQKSTSAASHASLLPVTNCYLASSGNGGSVTNSNGYDIIFTSDSGGSTPLTWEIDEYNVTGSAVFWVKIPTLSHTADTVIYVFYGNAAITTFQSTAASVWSNSFVSVYHFGNGASLSAADSLGTNTGSITGSPIASVPLFPVYPAGQDGGSYFNNSGGNYIDLGAASSLNLATLTFESWVIPINGALPYMVFSKCNGTTQGWETYVGAGGFSFQFGDGSLFALYRVNSGPSISSPFHIAVTITGSTGLMYVNGSSVAFSNLGAAATGIAASSVNANIGARTGTLVMGGNIDEMRISNVVRSADWITQTYNSQFSGTSFYTLSAGGAGPTGGFFRVGGPLSGIGTGGPFFTNPLN